MPKWTEGEKVRPDLQMVTPNRLAPSRRLLALRLLQKGNPHSGQSFKQYVWGFTLPRIRGGQTVMEITHGERLRKQILEDY